ncbi:MAG: ATP-binding cassette domain-containing protein [Pseudomonadota bacterium]
MIEVRSLRKQFGDVVALQDLSFTAEDGQITGLLGPNGAGKTTCLRMLFGLLKPDNGTALVDGIDASADALTTRARIGIFPDKFGSYERLTVTEQVEFFASLQGLAGSEKKQAVTQVIGDLQMNDIADRKSSGFSQGQRMKIALAQALVHRPPNLIMDEPTRGLDVMSTRMLRRHLAELREAGHCILFSSHVMQEVAALCDRIVIVAEGRLAAAGTTEELCALAGETQLEDAFVKLIGTDEGVAA